jgi:hypothetical protein
VWDCNISADIWDNTFTWLKTHTGIDIMFTQEEIILGCTQENLQLFNLVVSGTKKNVVC